MSAGWAPALAAGTSDGRWVSADEHAVHVWSGETLQRSVDVAGLLGGPPRVCADGSVLAGRFRIDPETGTASELLSLESILDAYDPHGDVNQLLVREVAWTADAAVALVNAEYRPTRLLGGTDAAMPGSMLAVARLATGEIQVLDAGPFLAAGPVVADRWLVAGGESLQVLVADTGTERYATEPGSAVTAVATVADTVIAGLADGAVLTLDLTADAAPERAARHGAVVDAVALSAGGALAASGDRSGGLAVWRVGSPEPVLETTVPGRVDGLCFLADDHLVVAVGGPAQQFRHLSVDPATSR